MDTKRYATVEQLTNPDRIVVSYREFVGHWRGGSEIVHSVRAGERLVRLFEFCPAAFYWSEQFGITRRENT